MVWLRKSLFHLLSLLLLVSLLGCASSMATRLTFGRPTNVKHWLNQSDFYDHFVTNTVNQAQEASDSSGDSQISFHDPAVQQAAKTALSQQFFQQNVATIIDSNYVWLQGKTSTPKFSIDLNGPKQNFAHQIGKYAQTHLANVPACSLAQLAQFQNPQSINPLTVTCRPPGLNANTAGAAITQRLANNSDFLSNTTITPQSLNPSQKNQGQPYYQKVAYAPRLYQFGLVLPFIFAGLILFCIIGIFFLAPRRRVGLRRTGIILLLAGTVLILTKFLADFALTRIVHGLTNTLNSGELQHSLTSFLHLAEQQLIKINLYFGIAYILLACGIIIGLLITRRSPQAVSAPPMPRTNLTTATPTPQTEQPSQPTRSRLIQ